MKTLPWVLRSTFFFFFCTACGGTDDFRNWKTTNNETEPEEIEVYNADNLEEAPTIEKYNKEAKSEFVVTINESMYLTEELAEPDEKTADRADDEDQHPCELALEDPSIEKISGKEQRVTLAGKDYLVLHLTGSENAAEISVAGDPDSIVISEGDEQTAPSPELPMVEKVCVFLGGNKSKASIDLSYVMTGEVYVRGRGNSPEVTLHIAETASVDNLVADLKGNNPTLTVSGDGQYQCPEKSKRGTIFCE